MVIVAKSLVEELISNDNSLLKGLGKVLTAKVLLLELLLVPLSRGEHLTHCILVLVFKRINTFVGVLSYRFIISFEVFD